MSSLDRVGGGVVDKFVLSFDECIEGMDMDVMSGITVVLFARMITSFESWWALLLWCEDAFGSSSASVSKDTRLDRAGSTLVEPALSIQVSAEDEGLVAFIFVMGFVSRGGKRDIFLENAVSLRSLRNACSSSSVKAGIVRPFTRIVRFPKSRQTP